MCRKCPYVGDAIEKIVNVHTMILNHFYKGETQSRYAKANKKETMININNSKDNYKDTLRKKAEDQAKMREINK